MKAKQSMFPNLLTSRPPNMQFQEYKQDLRDQNEKLNGYLKRGNMFYLASEIYIQKLNDVETKMHRKFAPFVRKKTFNYKTA
jgi:hypothetical protein